MSTVNVLMNVPNFDLYMMAEVSFIVLCTSYRLASNPNSLLGWGLSLNI